MNSRRRVRLARVVRSGGLLAAGLIGLSSGVSAAQTDVKGDPATERNLSAGAEIYTTTCRGCHEVAIGPPLTGVVGRPVASVGSFANYSDALKSRRQQVWTTDELDRYLAGPAEYIPGTLMMQAVPDAGQRADLIAYLVTLDAAGTDLVSTDEPGAALPAGPVTVAVRRVTESQYRNTIADVFGDDVEVNARFEPERRDDGLLAIGNADLSLTSAGFEQYFSLARSVAAQALAPEKREAMGLDNCGPETDPAARDSCVARFLSGVGERLFRRPLTDAELNARITTAMDGALRPGDFQQGLELALTSLLSAPEFLFRIETAEPDPESPGRYRLDGYTRAGRLSFLFWNTSPDPALLEAAGSGALYTPEGLDREIRRLTASSRFENGARAFFADMLQLDGFDNLIKDPAIYPKFNQAVADSAREQMLKTVVDLLVVREQDYRDLFTSNETFINRPLASVYKVAYPSSDAWAPYEFPASSGRSGILTQIGFLSLFAHPGTSSPTRRGIKIHEIFMCEPTPDPPADVDFSKVKDSTAGTVRGRLLDHMENTGCVACHRRSDPPGLALEHFDGLGQLRRFENGVLIDVSATLNGIEFEGAPGLGALLREDPRVPACLVRNVYAYSAGRSPGARESDYLAAETSSFAGDGYRVPELMVRMAGAPEFLEVVLPAGLQANAGTGERGRAEVAQHGVSSDSALDGQTTGDLP